MVQSVELLLDDALDAAVRRQWQALADAGLPSLAAHRSASNRPHVTLAVSREPWPADVEAAVTVAALAGPLPLEVRLGGLVVFGHRTRHVVARLVVPSSGLLALQARLAAAATAAPGAVSHTAPGRWTPHVTLARAVRGDQFPAVLAALAGVPGLADGADGAEPAGHGVAVRRWDGEARREWRVAPSPDADVGTGAEPAAHLK